MTAVEYTPPLGEAVEFLTGRDVPYRLLGLDGIGPVAVGAISRKSPGQVGVTAIDVLVPPRVIVLQSLIQAASLTDLWPVRAALSRALVVEPALASATDPYALGRLRIRDRVGSPDLEVGCIPQSVAMPMPAGNVGIAVADVEFFAPQPWWESLYESQLVFSSTEGGLEWPVEWPLEFETNNVEQEAVNEGDVTAPVTMRLYGELTTPRMTNVTTGEAIEVTGPVAAGEYLEIITAFAGKRVELVAADGTRTNAMDRLNLDVADFWRLRPGSNTVRFEATVNTSGVALLLWRSRYSGI